MDEVEARDYELFKQVLLRKFELTPRGVQDKVPECAEDPGGDLSGPGHADWGNTPASG